MSSMSYHRKKHAPTPIYQQYALLAFLLVCVIVVVLGLYEAISTGASPLFFVISYFMVVKSVNMLVYWVHLTIGFCILGLLCIGIFRLSRHIKRQKVKS